jgi:CRISPR-associated protein Csm2
MNRLLNNKISFKKADGKLADMFDSIAKDIAKKLNDTDSRNKPDISTTQFRKFYDKILELSEKSIALSEDEFKVEILPFVKMINSKVQYSKSRGHCGQGFVQLMEISIKQVNSVEELQNFKYFLESIIGFMPKK